MSEKPETTVVIRAFNEAAHLPTLLERLGEQQYRDFEVVVVDSGSFDETRDIARAGGARLVELQPSQFTFGHSLNVGIEAAAGRFIAIVSAHTEPVDDRWLGSLVTPLSSPDVAMVYGRQRGAPTSKFSEAQDFERTFGAARLDLTPPNYFANNANAGVRRDLWAQRPFDATLPGLEDADWARAWMERGYRVVYEPDAAIFHIHDESWDQVRHRYYREAVAARRIGLKRRRDAMREAGAELWRLVEDLGASLGEPGRFASRAREVVWFRANKAFGTAKGLLNGKAIESTEARAMLYFDRTYQAVVVEGPHKAAMRERRLPSVSADDVVVRVAYVGVCGTDLEIADGTLDYFRSGLGTYPIVPGHEMSGRVAAAGAGVEGLSEHDPVVVECIQGCGACDACRAGNAIGCVDRREMGVLRSDGAYAEYLVVPRRFVHRLPEGFDMPTAVLCEPLAVVLKGIGRLPPPAREPGRAITVVGAGTIGRLAALVLNREGCQVTLVDRDPARLSDLPSTVTVTADTACLSRCDTIVEASGSPDALKAALADSRAGCTILLLGLPYAEQPFNFEQLVAYDKAVVGSVGSSSEHFREAIRLLPELEADALVDTVLPLASFADAWQRCRTRSALKVLLQPSPLARDEMTHSR